MILNTGGEYLSYLEINKSNNNIEEILLESGISIDTDIRVLEVKGEDSNLVFRIENNNYTYALKIFISQNGLSDFYTNIFFNKSLIKNTIKTPKILHFSDNSDQSKSPWIIWEWVPGKLSCDIEGLSDRKKAAIKTGIELRKIHDIRMLHYGYIDNNNEWTGNNINITIDFFVNKIINFTKKGCEIFSKDELNNILNLTVKSRELVSSKYASLLHGDITGGNIIVNSNDIIIIDPGDIIAGDPMSDLGYTQTTSLHPVYRQGVWEGYTKNKPLTEKEYASFLRWRLLRQCIIAVQTNLNNLKNAKDYVRDTHSFLKEILENNNKI